MGEWKIWPSVSPIYQKQRQEAGRWGWLGLHPCPLHRVTQVFTFSFSSSLLLFFLPHPARLGRLRKGPRVGVFGGEFSQRFKWGKDCVERDPGQPDWGDLGSGKEGPEMG